MRASPLVGVMTFLCIALLVLVACREGCESLGTPPENRAVVSVAEGDTDRELVITLDAKWTAYQNMAGKINSYGYELVSYGYELVATFRNRSSAPIVLSKRTVESHMALEVRDRAGQELGLVPPPMPSLDEKR